MAVKALEVIEMTDEYITIRVRRMVPMKPSKSSKSILVATTGGIKATPTELDDDSGRQLSINCTVFVENTE